MRRSAEVLHDAWVGLQLVDRVEIGALDLAKDEARGLEDGKRFEGVHGVRDRFFTRALGRAPLVLLCRS